MSAQDLNCSFCEVRDKCVFSVLSDDEKQKLNEDKIQKTCKKEHYIYHEGFGAADYVIIRNGFVKLTKQNGVDTECIVDFKKSGDLMGMESLGDKNKYETSAVALTDTSICIIQKSLALDFFMSNHKVCNYMVNSFIVSVSSFLNRILHITNGTGRAKLARTLLLVSQYLPDGKKKEIKIKREELAALSGISRETVSRLLASFKTRKVIDIKVNVIRILDSKKLEQLSK